MSLIDVHAKEIIRLASALSKDDIFNIYQLKGALPERKCVNEKGELINTPYVQADMYVLFGVEEADNGGEAVIITDQNGAPDNTIIITNRFNIKVLFNGDEADFYAIKLKARLWSKSVTEYLEKNNLSLHTQNPSISFETEEIAGEFWSRRGIQFTIIIELHFDDEESEEIIKIGKTYTHET